ncbi:MAG TPA: glycoside hydrolase family 15 protein, partial [Acetobacteraceae bacterium]|nr:glycoside hydrolase family 15 protein [Acetobacteraceae bacterium]
GVPVFHLHNVSRDGIYTIDKEIVSDPEHDTVLQRIRLTGQPGLRLFALLAPHLVNGGGHNTGWIGEYKGVPMLFAEGDGTYLALACSAPFLARSAGYAGVNDGWQDVSRNGRLTGIYDRAENGNVALTAEISLASGGPVVLALGFGRKWTEAAFRARASLQRGFDAAEAGYAEAWREWQSGLARLDPPEARRVRVDGGHGHNLYRISTAVLRCHESPTFPGGLIASLSIPWGASKGDDDLGGYHLVWPRDLAETAGGLIAANAGVDARRVLDYLRVIQQEDGSWAQNNWLDGMPYWHGLQMDECAFPILLVEMMRRNGLLSDSELRDFWPMVRDAAGFVLRNGPATAQDRWEEDAGYSPFTLAVEVAALLAAAEAAELMGEAGIAGFLRDTADAWNEDIDAWTYAKDTPLAREAGVEGYYVRITPRDGDGADAEIGGIVMVRNKPPAEADVAASALISPDALALVRFGLRAADDPRILNTVRVIDQVTRVELPQGPGWRRYNDDGYGEHEDGSPFDGTGQGRTWPLLIGERAHYELARGDEAEARRLLAVMEACSSDGGLLPEQVWDADDIPERELFRGRPSGSAMPLVWAHAEYIKLLRSLADGAVFDMSPLTVQRYQREKRRPRLRDWRESWRRGSIPQGQILRVELCEAATLHWSADDWRTTQDTRLEEIGLGIFAAELPTQALKSGAAIRFTWCRADGSWRGQDFSVLVSG